ncbi:MAG: DUF1365 domain-containing protein [Burkholderiaceae bacterium]
MNSAIYVGWLDHHRVLPRAHAFRYRLFMVYLDLAELERVFAGRWLWSTTGRAFARFKRSDHLGDPAVALDQAVRDLVAERTGWRPDGPIRLLTHLRILGYVFNPVSFYYCFDAAGERLEAVVAEVNNTPWGERHCYVMRRPPDAGRRWRARSGKRMHVSPFHPMSLDYDWQFGTPGDALSVHMSLRSATSAGTPETTATPPSADAAAWPAATTTADGNARDAEASSSGSVLFGATLALQRRPISGTSLAATLARFPWMTARVIVAIHWQALRLWLRGVPVHDHPDKHPHATVPAGPAAPGPRRPAKPSLSNPHPENRP